ncbi:MAG: group II intron reverse transcriptase/maturase [Betaproteobacteria bacterium RIFCSPLOWO2_02_FULL_67_19]|nr:MAG: group II intron reverse transcriptase/maturase [Betaproteobacteria bacterium RIFCSPLOWO2_02_FULL_67_19]
MRVDEAQAQATATGTGRSARHAPRLGDGAEARSAAGGRTKAEGLRLMEAVVERGNMRLAYQRVVQNKGAPGVDGLPVAEFEDWLKVHWLSIRAALLEGRYIPQAVRAVDIPKAGGGTRTLGIPTVLDRLIQQALLQVLQPIFEPTFSESSYGFRPGRSAQQAVRTAQRYVREGLGWVVDIDLEKFFDRVNHDIVMSRLAREIEDARVLKLIRRFLEAGLMKEGLVRPRIEGTPQGGPLSPLLSNIVLTDLDRELERREHRFCRYADDCNAYVRTQAAAHRLMGALTGFLEGKLKLKVNAAKSACARVSERKFLGYALSRHREAKLKAAQASIKRLAQRVRETVRGNASRNLAATIEQLNPLLRGWMTYFRFTEIKGVLQDLDGWIRRKLRALLWRQCKRVYTRVRMLRRRGLDEVRAWRSATNGRGPWWNAGASHMNAAYPKSYFAAMGLVSLLDTQQRLQRVS